MPDIRMLEVHAAAHTYEASRKILQEFKDKLSHGDIVVIKGYEYPVWRMHEMWNDWPESILVFDKAQKEGLWKGMERKNIEDIENVIPKEAEAKK